MTALRQRLIEDMQVRNYSPRTVEAYVAAVVKLAKHFMRSPDQLAREELRAFQVHLLSAEGVVVAVQPDGVRGCGSFMARRWVGRGW